MFPKISKQGFRRLSQDLYDKPNEGVSQDALEWSDSQKTPSDSTPTPSPTYDLERVKQEEIGDFKDRFNTQGAISALEDEVMNGLVTEESIKEVASEMQSEMIMVASQYFEYLINQLGDEDVAGQVLRSYINSFADNMKSDISSLL